MALDGISFLAADVSSLGFGREAAPIDRRRSARWRSSPTRSTSSRRSSNGRSRSTRATSSRDSSPKSPDKLRRLPRYYAALRGDAPFPRGVVQRAVGVGRDRGRRRGAPVLLSRRDRQHAPGAARDDRHAATCARFGESLDVGADPVCVRCVCSLKTSWRSAPWACLSRALARHPARRSTASPPATTGRTRDNPILCAMRARVLGRSPRFAPAGARLLDLGCGPGRTRRISRAQGYRVTAIDWSPAMVERGAAAGARRRRRRIASTSSTSASTSSIGWRAGAPFDAAYSNFGPLNCVADLPARGAADRGPAAARRRAGGVGHRPRLSVGNRALSRARRLARAPRPLSPRARAGAARRRHGLDAVLHAAASSSAIFAAAGFTRVSLRALGLFAPPPYLQAFADRHPSLVDGLQRVEDRCGGWPALRGWGDHFLIVLAEGLSRVAAAIRLSRVPHRPRRRRGPSASRAPAAAACSSGAAASGAFSRPTRGARLEPFVRQYRARARARGTASVRAGLLPPAAVASRRAIRTPREWRVRRETYHHLLGHVLAAGPLPLHVLDLGAGSGWLSHRLTALGHRAVAVDALDDEVDGLGAARHYPTAFASVQADFDALPFAPGQFDLVVFNGSLHYAADTAATLERRAPRARARRHAGGDGLADVPRRRRRPAMVGAQAAALQDRRAAAPTSCSRASAF